MSIFSVGKGEQSIPEEPRDLEAILARISAGASGRDAHPSFPVDPFVRLAPTGVLAIPVPDPIGRQGRRPSFAEEWRVLRAVAGADGSHPFAISGPLDRAGRDLELFLLQHRLEPALIHRGRQAISERRPRKDDSDASTSRGSMRSQVIPGTSRRANTSAINTGER
jgi:hypothetical protein